VLPDAPVTAEILTDFYDRWQNEALVVNQWFLVQATSLHCTVERLASLVAHPAFRMTNPNKVRSVLTAFAAGNQRNFHAPGGEGYRYVADRIVELNGINPQMAAGLAKPLTRWRRYSGNRSSLMRSALERIADADDLSTDVYEVVSKSLD
jgi:aminopeptidase N